MFKLSVAASFRIAFILIIAFQAILVAYGPMYFSSLGFTPFQVSLISGMENIMGILGPALLVARAYPRGLGITILSGLSAFFTFCISPFFGTALLVLIWSASLFFNRGVFVLINEDAQVRDKEGLLNYSESRSWGSASFLLAMYGLGLVVERLGVASAMTVGAIMLALLSVVGLQIEEVRLEQGLRTITDFLKNSFSPWHFFYYLALTLVWASHGPAYTYMSLHLLNLGWSPSEIAISWDIAVVAEIVMFLIFGKIERFISLDKLLTFTMVASVVRWTILSQTSNAVIINLSQLLHGLTFGLCFVVSQKLLRQSVDEEYRKPAFAVYFALTLGFGSLLGKFAAGWATRSENFNGDFHQIFQYGTYLAIASLLAWCLRRTTASQTGQRAMKSL